MAPNEGPPLYSDTPLTLLETPAFRTGQTDSFTLEASYMTLAHNSLIRGFNGIYQQAPRIPSPSADYEDFIKYCLAWHRCVEEHHHFEEVNFFPAIEEATGEKGVMDIEVQEHAAFHSGLDDFKSYLTSLNSQSDFNATRLLEIMDSFSEPLHIHLAAEPQALVALSRFSTPERPIDLVKIARETGKKSVTLDFALNVMPIFFNNMESVEFEGGRWRHHPDIPGPLRWIMKNVLPLWHWRQWRFMSCTSDGRRKQLVC